MGTKEKIIKSALKLFVKNGLSANTTSITKDAGVSSGILFHYYPTKNDLIIDLYAKCMLEYYQALVHIMWIIPKNDLEKYKTIHKLSWNSTIDWGLDNWDKFQFIQLFESSLLADQFKLGENKEIEELINKFSERAQLGVEYGYLKDLPVPFIVDLSIAAITVSTGYLHKNSQYRYDKAFREKIWQIHWELFTL
jgi:AcrR family transcriptional regulator